MDYEKLYEAAKLAMEKAYAPYSNFKVGAALLTETDDIYTGINIENASYGVTICAERVALSKAVADGHRKFKAIAVASSEGEAEAWPCGICRQMMNEFCDKNFVIITGASHENSGETSLEVQTLEQLLPKAFKL